MTAGGQDALSAALDEAQRRGLIGPGAVGAHVTHAKAFAAAVFAATGQALPRAPEILDLGSGGGLPGLVIAVEHPEARLTLLDARRRSTDFLSWGVRTVGLGDRVRVVHGRAEVWARDLSMRERYDLVTVRAVGPPPVAAELAAGFVRSAGFIAISEPPGGGVWDEAALAGIGCRLGPSVARDGATVRVLAREGPIPRRVPRRDGMPAKRPLW